MLIGWEDGEPLTCCHRHTREIPDLVYCHGAQIGGLWVFADHTCKTNVSTIFVHRVVFYVCLSLDCSKCRWHTHTCMMNHYGKKPKTPNLSHMSEWNGAGSGTSCVYQWVTHVKSTQSGLCWWPMLKCCSFGLCGTSGLHINKASYFTTNILPSGIILFHDLQKLQGN